MEKESFRLSHRWSRVSRALAWAPCGGYRAHAARRCRAIRIPVRASAVRWRTDRQNIRLGLIALGAEIGVPRQLNRDRVRYDDGQDHVLAAPWAWCGRLAGGGLAHVRHIVLRVLKSRSSCARRQYARGKTDLIGASLAESKTAARAR